MSSYSANAPALFAALIAAALQAVPQAGLAASVNDRIDQGLEAADVLPPPETDPTQLGISSGISAPRGDASLLPGADTSRLRTTLEPVDIEQRIDKGLTAAGESSAFPPDYAFGAFQRGWFLTAFSLALERAENGDAVAQTLLGVLLSRGLGVKQDLSAAADWYRLAADRGDPEALYALGQFYLDGSGVKKDMSEAGKLFRQAADKGHAGAARELGYLLLTGKGENQDPMLAAAYLSRAARKGDMDAQYTLAGLFVEGAGVANDESQAARWYGEAARNGHVGAQVEYAIMLYNGTGVTKDEAEAVHWFRRAAEADNPAAQVRLARILSEGSGAPKDEAAAARWYLIAKASGVDDDFMEERLGRLDKATREKAEAEARDWSTARHGRVLASARTAEAREAVDNSVE